ncbi:MAG: ribose-5-phosphate isomerase RpiA [Pseudomonadota bacterium]
MDFSAQKKNAAAAALEHIENGVSGLGIGTGSTVNELIAMLPQYKDRIETVVSSSEASTQLLQQYGFEVSELNDVGSLELYIDGADEVTKHFDLLKGGGGALTREKILAGAARKFICIADESKLVGMLGSFPLPIEVIPMARSFVGRQIIKMRGQPFWREGYITDNGNEIIDIHNLSIVNPKEMESRLNQIPGVVTVGLFAHRGADVLIIGDATGAKTFQN